MHVPADITLRTERLMLRAVDFCDIDLVWDASRFEGFNDGMTWDPPDSRDELTQITQRNCDDWRDGKCYIFTACTQNTNIAIGRVGLHKEAEPNTWNIGFWVHPDHWGRGYAPEAARAVLEFGFETLNAERIETDHATWNARSQSVIESLGFEFVRENPAGFYKNDKAVAVLEYVLTVNGARS